MSKSIFVSHAVRDKDIVELIVELIEDGIGVPESEIFCSSLDGYGIPTGDNFIHYIKSQIQEPKIVILLLTPCYFNSHFCLSELGAAWVKSHKIFPIIVPPLSHENIKDVLTATQAINISDGIKYNELRDYLITEIKFKPKSSTKWDTKRKSFLKKINIALKNIDIPIQISENEHTRVCSLLKEAETDLEEYEDELCELKAYVKEVESAKDILEVDELKAKHYSTGISEEFEAVVNEIASYKDVLGSKEVLKFVLTMYYDKPYRIDHNQYGDEFANAARYKFISLEDGEEVNWNNQRVAKLNASLDRLTYFVEEDERGEELFKYNDNEYNVALEPDNQEFWEYHYDI